MTFAPYILSSLCALGGTLGAAVVFAQPLDPDFKPELVGADFSAREVRPGDLFSVTIRFRNVGTRPARSDYHVFLHFEAPQANCAHIVLHADHAPDVPTSLWEPGEIIVDGPRCYVAPANLPEQDLHVHLGLYDLGGTGQRLLDTYDAGVIRVTRQAPAVEDLGPQPLSAEELAQREAALAARIRLANRVGLEGETWRFDLDRSSGAWALLDKTTGVLWASDPARPCFASVRLRHGGLSRLWEVNRFDEVDATSGALRLISRPRVDGADAGLEVVFTITPMGYLPGIRITYESEASGPWSVDRVSLLEDALWATEAEDGCVYVPERLGIELPASAGLPSTQEWMTYDNLSMAMCGVVKRGSALLVNWDNVDTRLRVRTSWPDHPLVPGRRMRSLSLEVLGPEGGCTVHPLGPGGYVEIARAYRPLAREKGWLRTWADKRLQFPTVDRLFGAANFKPFVLSRVMPSSRFSDGREHVHLGFTFDEVARCAEHWRNDLGIDRAYVVMAGWINGGYDVRHPDILPAAPECGGNEGLRDACDRIKACGYLVGLHDNYQDMYEDAPSWGLEWLNKTAAGVPKMGGNWNGGQAWQVCAIKQVELAARPETNLPRVAELFGPTIYFIDTVFAWPLVTCEDPAHPMARRDDLEWKTRLCMLAKQYFGLFGSEEGREWAVPCADYLEGIFGHQTDSGPGQVIPLFPLVYSDCIQIMTHQGNRIGPGDEKKMADHILFAEMQLPSFGEHLYWTRPEAGELPVAPLAPTVRDLGNRKFAITYRWRVDGRLGRDLWVFVHFTHPAATRPEGIAYQNDHAPTPPTSQWEPGTIVEDGPYTVEVPLEFDGPTEVLVGMTDGGGRVAFKDLQHSGLRYRVGTITTTPDGISFEPAPPSASAAFWSRGDGGWGEALCPSDRIIKNTWEVLSPLNLLTAERPLDSHEFLSADRLLQRTRFGDVTITVSYEKPARIGDDEVPPYGFIVDSPAYIAFCATRYNGVDYDTPTLFTARSLDGQPISQSEQVRIYQGFGGQILRLNGRDFGVAREAVVSMR